MKLNDYLKKLEIERAEDLARRCKTTLGHLKQIAYGHRRANAALAIDLDRESGGVVTCEDIRPDIDWAYIRSSHRWRD